MSIALGNLQFALGCGNNGLNLGAYYGQMDEFYIFSRELSAVDVWCLEINLIELKSEY